MGFQEGLGIHQLEKLENYLGSTAEFVAQLINQCAKKGGYVKDSQKAAKLLLQHLNNGKTIENIIVEKTDSAIMRRCLEANHVPYVSIAKTSSETGKEEEIIMIRDSDRQVANKAFERFQLETGNGIGELVAEKFVDLNKNSDITVLQGLDKVMIELYRKHAQEKGFPYAIKESTDQNDKYDVLCMPRDKEKCDSVLKKSAYELSGESGNKLTDEIMSYINIKETFDTQLRPKNRDEIMYVVDSKNPTIFMSVTRDGYATHNIGIGKDGSLIDNNSYMKPSYAREELMATVSSLNKPIILTESEFKLIKNISAKGIAEPINKEDFDKELQSLRQSLKGRTDYFHDGFEFEENISDQNIYTVHNLTDKQCISIYSEIQSADVEDVTIYGNALAYTEKNKDVVEKAICKILYDGMDGLQQKEASIFHDGRGEILLAEPCPINQYLVDTDNPNLSIIITPIGFALCESGKIVVEKERLADSEYDNHLLQAIEALSSPVALSEVEMKSSAEEKISIIKNRIPELQTCPAAEYLKKSHERELEKILNLTYRDNYKMAETPNVREKEAIEKLKEYKYVDIYVDRTITEKIMELSIEKKVKSERIHGGNGEDRTTFDR